MDFLGDIHLLYELVHVPLESLQFMSLTFVPEVGWDPDMFSDLEDLSFVRLNIDGPDFKTLFILICCLCLFFFLVAALLTQVELCEDLPDMLWYGLGKHLVFGFFFVPLVSNVLAIFPCKDGSVYRDKNIECSGGEHVGLMVLGIITLILFIPGALLKAVMKDQESRDITKKTHYESEKSMIDARYLLIRLLIIAFSMGAQSTSKSTRVACIAIMFVLSIYPFYFFVYYIPHAYSPLNYLKCGFYLATTYSFLISLSVVDGNSDSSTGLAAYPALVVAGMLITYLRSAGGKKEKPLPVWEFEGLSHVDVLSVRYKHNEATIAKVEKLADPEHFRRMLSMHAQQSFNDLDEKQGEEGGEETKSVELLRIEKKEEEPLPERNPPVSVTATIQDKEGMNDFRSFLDNADQEAKFPFILELTIIAPKGFSNYEDDAPASLEAIVSLLSSDNSYLSLLESVCVKGLRMSHEEALNLVRTLITHCPNLLFLQLYNCHLKDQTSIEIAKLVSESEETEIRYVNLNGNPTSARGQTEIEHISDRNTNILIEAF